MSNYYNCLRESMRPLWCPKSHEMTEGYPLFLEIQIFLQTERGCPFPMNPSIRSLGNANKEVRETY